MIEFELSSFVVRDAMDRAIDNVDQRVHDKGVTLVSHEVSPSVEVTGHQASIEEALTNLLANAIKYTPAGGQIDLSADAQGDQVRVVSGSLLAGRTTQPGSETGFLVCARSTATSPPGPA